MIWIALAALGIPIWLLVGILAFALWSRWQFRHRPGVFVCRLQPAEPAAKPRGKRYAYWVHDVLLVHRGLALMRYEALPIASVAGPAIAPSATKGLGEQPACLRLQLDDGQRVDLVVRNDDLAPATGPFVASTT